MIKCKKCSEEKCNTCGKKICMIQRSEMSKTKFCRIVGFSNKDAKLICEECYIKRFEDSSPTILETVKTEEFRNCQR